MGMIEGEGLILELIMEYAEKSVIEQLRKNLRVKRVLYEPINKFIKFYLGWYWNELPCVWLGIGTA